MISNYSDPKVTLNQVYAPTTVGTAPLLGACIIGPNYFVRQYTDLGQALRLDSDDNYPAGDYSNSFTPQKGLSARPYPAREKEDGEVDITDYRPSVFVKNAYLKYLAFEESDSIVIDAEYGDDTINIIDQTGKTYVFNGMSADASALPVEAGDGVIVKLSEDTVQCIVNGFMKDVNGRYTKCVLSKSLPTEEIISVTFYKVADCYVDEACVLTDKTANTISVKTGATATKDFGLGQTQYDILKGEFYAEYRVLSHRYVGRYSMAASLQDVEQMLGKICPENPLGIAVANAVAQADSNFVYFTAIAQTSKDSGLLTKAYTEATDLVADMDGIYGIVPCTTDTQVLKALLQFVLAQSDEEIPYYKYLYTSVDIPTEQLLLNDVSLKEDATYNEEDNLTKVVLQGSPLLTIGTIVQGDTIKLDGYVITIKASNHKNILYVQGDFTKLLKAGTTIDIYDTLKNNADIVDSIIANKPFADKRAMIAFADGAIYNGYSVPNYCVAAALAGKRSGTYPHAPLSNVSMDAITTSEAHGFTASQSKKLGAYGFWRVGQNEDGVCISRRQLTSAALGDVNYDEQSIVCDIDSICLTLKQVGRDLVGNTNISSLLIGVLQDTLDNVLTGFTSADDAYIGPQLLSASILSIYQDQVNKDRIYATMEGEPPKPFNRFHMTFYMR